MVIAYHYLYRSEGQSKWVKVRNEINNLNIIKLTDTDYVRVFWRMLSVWVSVLLENVKEEVQSILNTMQKETFKSGAQRATW
jgi:hypothetical protein